VGVRVREHAIASLSSKLVPSAKKNVIEAAGLVGPIEIHYSTPCPATSLSISVSNH
jgi:hypothetical protein